MSRTGGGVSYDRAGPRGRPPIVFLHAGVADRRMWQPQWDDLTADRDAIRLDLTGFGESDHRPAGPIDHRADVLDTLDELAVEQAHLVGASYGAGVAVEVALTRPALVASLLLSAPGGCLLTERTPDLEAFLSAERSALAADDVAAAVEANLIAWVDGPGQPHRRVPPVVRAEVARMQRRVFDIDRAWGGEVDYTELDPPAVQRLAEIHVPTLVLTGELDLSTIQLAAAAVLAGVRAARRVSWPGVAHLPSLERPAEFTALVREHIG